MTLLMQSLAVVPEAEDGGHVEIEMMSKEGQARMEEIVKRMLESVPMG